MIFLVFFGISASLALGYIYWNAKVLMIRQLNQTVEAEILGLSEQYRQGGIRQLVKTVAARSKIPGNSLYLVTSPSGEYIAGNLATITVQLWNTEGPVRFTYKRPAQGGPETRQAFAKGFRLQDNFRLLVGRDIEDRRIFERVIADVLWGLGFITLFGIFGGWLVSRNILSRIDTVTDASKRIMSGDLSERIPVKGSGDELDRLSINLNEMLDRIERLMAGMREVSDNIAHDLKTPLNRMRNRIDAALRDGTTSPAHKEILETTIEDADFLIQTFNALLSIARMEAGTGSRNMETMEIAPILSDIAELYEPVMDEQNFELKTDFQGNIILNIDKQLIGQAVANLIDNAIKYAAHTETENTDRKPQIFIATTRQGDFGEIIVADHGPGIPEEDREHVCERFVRLEKSRSLPGSGLGLSLVSAVVQLHNGKLILEDNDPGLKAIIQLPLVEKK